MQARFDVRDALHEMAELNNVIQDTHGNVSQRDGDRFFIKPSGVEYKHVDASDVCEIMFDGNSSDNQLTPSVDTIHHKKIYELNQHVGAICHTHSPYATAYAALCRNLYCYTTEQADYFGGQVNCREYSDLNSWGNICVGKHERAILLECHGVLTFGKNADEAVKLASVLEQIAQKNFLIESLAKSLISSPSLWNVGLQSYEGEVKKWNDRYKEVYGQKNDTHSE